MLASAASYIHIRSGEGAPCAWLAGSTPQETRTKASPQQLLGIVNIPVRRL